MKMEKKSMKKISTKQLKKILSEHMLWRKGIGESKADNALEFLNKYFVEPRILEHDHETFKIQANDVYLSIQSNKIINIFAMKISL